MDLYKERVIYPIALTRDLEIIDPYEASRYLTIRVAISKYYLADPVNNINSYEVILDAPYKPCKDLENKKWLEDFNAKGFENVVNLTYAYGLCPDLDGQEDKLKVEGKFEDPPYIHARVYIGPCSLPSRSQCKTLEEMTSTTVVIATPKKMFDFSNKKNPLKTVLQLDKEYSIDATRLKVMNYNSKRVRVYDDSWDFFEPVFKLEYSYFELDYMDSSEYPKAFGYCQGGELNDFINGRCPTYILLLFIATGDLTKITRSYPKVLDSVGQIGGVAEIFMVVGALIYASYNTKRLSRYLRVKLFGKDFVKDCSKFLYKEDGSEFGSQGEKRGVNQIVPEQANRNSKYFFGF